jgi:phospholipase/carboxylesterase
VLALHGAGGDAKNGLAPMLELAERWGLIVLAPDSRDFTWDMVIGEFGPDVAFIDDALAHTFEHCAVDRARLAIEGFSDGASYALSLGLANGDLFSHIVAFAPGFMSPPAQVGRPRIFVAHGTRDTVLPIDRCSRRLVPTLEHAGYEVTYREFDGPHTVPPDIAAAAVRWLDADERESTRQAG